MSDSIAVNIIQKCMQCLSIPIKFIGIKTSLLEVMVWELVAVLVLSIVIRIFSKD